MIERAGISLVLGLVLAGCVGPTAVAPRGAPMLAQATPQNEPLSRYVLWVDYLVEPAGELPQQARTELRSALQQTLWGEGLWAAMPEHEQEAERIERQRPELTRLRLVPRVVQDYSVSRTYVLDVLSVATYLLLPAPSWGEVSVRLEIDVLDRAGRPLCASVTSVVEASHGTVMAGWVRDDQLELALQRAYGEAMSRVARGVAECVLLEAARVAREQQTRATVAVASRAPLTHTASVALPVSTASVALATTSTTEGGPAPANITIATTPVVTSTPAPDSIAWRRLASGSALAAAYEYVPQDEPIFLPPDGFDILTRPLARDDQGFLGRYLSALGGVEVAAFRGGARVESRTRTANATDELVGSGEAVASGYRLSFYRPPDRTGFFFPPSAGLLWEDITITGFREEVPLARSGDIPAVASDPASGARVDLGEPLSYDLRLRSAYVGQGIGLNLVAGDDTLQLFFTLHGHLNLLEVRYVEVELGPNTISGVSVVPFRSIGLGGQMGVVWPEAHLALRAMFSTELYFEFAFPEEVEFQASTRYVPEKDVFERERAFVTGASLNTFNGQISAIVLF
jgi:hypothetical protein